MNNHKPRRFKVKDMDINTGSIPIAIINYKDAQKLDLFSQDRVTIHKQRKSATAVLNISETKKAVPSGSVGLFEELLATLDTKHGDTITLGAAQSPPSVQAIRKKLFGGELNFEEFSMIVKDFASKKLTSPEKTYFVASLLRGLTFNETVAYTEAIMTSGKTVSFNGGIFDKHCIGGVPNNRTTMIIAPIITAAGVIFPKTSSRTITSPAGTADVMEIFAEVNLSPERIKQVVKQVRGCIAWGGSMNLAPADSEIIGIRVPLEINTPELVVASVLAKKGSVGARHVLIDIPLGPQAKVTNSRDGHKLGSLFVKVGKAIGMNVRYFLSDGSAPVGKGVGALLEALDVEYILKNDPRGPKDLCEKSLTMAGMILEMAGKTKRGYSLAKEILTSGKAYKQMQMIIDAQGRKKQLPSLGKYSKSYVSPKKGNIMDADVVQISRIAKIVGAPYDQGAGMYLHVNKGDRVKQGERLFTVYAESKQKLIYADEIIGEKHPFVIS